MNISLTNASKMNAESSANAPVTRDVSPKDIATNSHGDFTVSLDIGTTKIVIIVGRKNAFNKIEIIGYGKVPSPSGAIRNGQVLNVEETAKSIREALRLTQESNTDLPPIKSVYVGIAGEHVKCFQSRGDLVRQGDRSEETITQEEVNILKENQLKSFVPPSDQIMDVYPLNYSVDNHTDILNPVGMYGTKIGGNFNLISADKTAINQIRKSIEKAGLEMKKIYLQPIASAQAVMCAPDLENIVAILDIGGGTSDLAIFKENKLIHTVVIPMGGEVITQDIKEGLGISKTQAEAIKVQFGSAIVNPSSSEKKKLIITIPGYRGLSPKNIDSDVLCGIIQARVEEILVFVNMHLQAVGLEGKLLSGGLILTGGGSQLKFIKQLAEYKTGAQVRIGYANEHLSTGQDEGLKSPSLSTSIGILIEGFSEEESINKNDVQEEKTYIEEVEIEESVNEIDNVLPLDKNPISIEKRKDLFGGMKKIMLGLFEETKDQKFE